jgi:hypothetical protein
MGVVNYSFDCVHMKAEGNSRCTLKFEDLQVLICGPADSEVAGLSVGQKASASQEMRTSYHDHMDSLFRGRKESGWPSQKGTAGANTEKGVQEWWERSDIQS